MMVTAEGEDYMIFAEASGLKNRTLFFSYAMRNALLPQTTALGLSLGTLLTGALLVEVIFNYPGIGGLLYFSIRQFDYFVIQGVIFTWFSESHWPHSFSILSIHCSIRGSSIRSHRLLIVTVAGVED